MKKIISLALTLIMLVSTLSLATVTAFADTESVPETSIESVDDLPSPTGSVVQLEKDTKNNELRMILVVAIIIGGCVLVLCVAVIVDQAIKMKRRNQ